MRILIIEDNPMTALGMEMVLSEAGFNVYKTDLGEDGVELAKLYDYDLITLDMSLPDISGLDVLRKIRAAKVATPVIMITGETGPGIRVDALNLGADDFMAKPYHVDELLARIRAVARRSKGHPQSLIRTGEITVDLASKQVTVDGATVHLTAKEYQMLELLSLRRGQALTKEMFLNHLYGGRDEPEIKIIDVFICKLRKKLRLAGGGPYIETVWGRGYVLRDPEAQIVGVQAVAA